MRRLAEMRARTDWQQHPVFSSQVRPPLLPPSDRSRIHAFALPFHLRPLFLLWRRPSLTMCGLAGSECQGCDQKQAPQPPPHVCPPLLPPLLSLAPYISPSKLTHPSSVFRSSASALLCSLRPVSSFLSAASAPRRVLRRLQAALLDSLISAGSLSCSQHHYNHALLFFCAVHFCPPSCVVQSFPFRTPCAVRFPSCAPYGALPFSHAACGVLTSLHSSASPLRHRARVPLRQRPPRLGPPRIMLPIVLHLPYQMPGPDVVYAGISSYAFPTQCPKLPPPALLPRLDWSAPLSA